ncbi:hypothetical protein OU995_25770 [Roseateles sp. SL47]|nr:hypothetical protein [Roseateles sp. SL47]WAC75972.1 hypothetical protein OU995_25770 [Roseateles sp. SL47]
MYVVLMMAAAEAMSPQGSLLGAVITFLLYGVLPLSIVLYLMGTPQRRAARKRAEAQAEAEAEARAPSQQPSGISGPCEPSAPSAPSAPSGPSGPPGPPGQMPDTGPIKPGE